MKILACLQYYEGDADEARALVRLIGELRQGRHCHVADFALASRAPAPDGREWGQDLADFEYVHHIRCAKCESGHPTGPNAMVRDVWRQCMGLTGYSGLLLLEPDTVILALDWLERIYVEWVEALAAGKLVLGHLHAGHFGSQMHINGTCVLSPKFSQMCPKFPDAKPHDAWDVTWREQMLAHGQPSREIINDPGSFNRWKGDFAGLVRIWGGTMPEGHPHAGEAPDPAIKTGHKRASQAHEVIRDRLLAHV